MELLDHVDSSSTPPSESSISSFGGSFSTMSAPSARSSWHIDDHHAMALISQSCDIDIWIEIGHLGTS